MRLSVSFLALHTIPKLLVAANPASVFSAQHLTRAIDVAPSYDYLIIGGGTSGLTVADRLTEDARYTVLVIEYGYFGNLDDISNVYPAGIRKSSASHLYNITAVGKYPAKVYVGCVVGGCSAVNAMVFPRGQREDYEMWASLQGGGRNWGWRDLLPYFRKASKFSPPESGLAKQFGMTWNANNWGNDTPVYASWPSFQWPTTKILHNAWKDVPGVEFPLDTGEGKPGVTWFPNSVDPYTNTRSYGRTAHHEPVKSRKNYAIITGHKGYKINFSASKGKPNAESVTVVAREGGEPFIVRANKEVIVAAGAVHSPQVLQRSGVGPKALLEAAKIPVVFNLPGVGQNFQDHTSLNVGYNFMTNAWPNPDTLKTNETYKLEVDTLWNKSKIGPYSMPAPMSSCAFLPFPVISPNKSSELASIYEKQDPAAYLPIGTDKTIIAGYKAQMKLLSAGIRSKNTAWMQMASSPMGSTAVTNLHPLSRGTINLNISDPAGEPIVDFRATSNPMDTRLFIELVRLVRRYFATQGVMKELSPVFFNPPLNVTSDEDLGAWVESVLLPTVYHPIGTCAMMPQELGGVVDDELLVYGVEGVRVVDASVMPVLIGANTSQTVYAVAEKAADLIRGLLKRKVRPE